MKIEEPMSEQPGIVAKLDDIIARLERIEQRQIAVREEIKETAAPVVGNFASSKLPHERH